MNAGKRVLWVVNQVTRAHRIIRSFVHELPEVSGTELHSENGTPIVCYHSRFKLSDRVSRHADTMKYLKAGWNSAALGVTTQVCEMSLDIDVDLLVTEDCPVTSLVQRMGRCNRQRDARALEQSGEVLVYAPANADNLPYDDSDLTGLSEFLQHVDGKDLSQSILEETMREVPCAPLRGDVLSQFLNSGAYAVGSRDDEGDDFRDSNDFNRQCVLDADTAAFRQATDSSKPAFILPVPKRYVTNREDHAEQYTGLPSYLAVAPQAQYHPAVGFLDGPVSDWRSGS